VSAADATRVGSIQTPGTAQTHVIGNTAYTTFSLGSRIPVVKPGEDVYIKVFSLPDGKDDCSSEFGSLQSAQSDFESAVSDYESECS
jgi:hypothetical protein